MRANPCSSFLRAALLALPALGTLQCTARAVVGTGGDGATGVTSDTSAATSDISGTNATASTGSGCVPACDDKRCGDDSCGGLCGGREALATWRIDFDLGPQRAGHEILPWPEGNSLILLHETDRVTRIDTCDGALLAERALATDGASLLGATMEGGELLVVEQRGDRRQIFHLDPRTLEDVAVPSPIVSPVALHGATRHEGAFLMPTTTDRQLGQVDFTGSSCFLSSGASYDGRVIGLAGDTIVGSYTAYDEGNAYTQLVNFTGLDAACMVPPIQVSGATVFEPFVLLVDGTDVFGVGARASNPGGETSWMPVIERRALPALDASARWEGESLGFFTNGFLDAILLDDEIVAVGQRQGQRGAPNDRSAQGLLFSLPRSFGSDAVPTRHMTFASVNRIRAIRREGDAVYLTGRAPVLNQVGGFVAKCTLDLECGLGTGVPVP